MQVIAHGSDGDGGAELAEILSQSEILQMIDHGGMRCYVLSCNGQDILLFAGGDGKAFTTYPCAAFDAEFGGSIHDQARSLHGE